MATRGRVQHRHGTYTQFDENKSTILADEMVIVDSGDPVNNGSALYYKPNGGTPTRLANSDEVPASCPKIITEDLGSGIPTTYPGTLGQIAFYEASLYFLSQILGTEEEPLYMWYKLIDEAD